MEPLPRFVCPRREGCVCVCASEEGFSLLVSRCHSRSHPPWGQGTRVVGFFRWINNRIIRTRNRFHYLKRRCKLWASFGKQCDTTQTATCTRSSLWVAPCGRQNTPPPVFEPAWKWGLAILDPLHRTAGARRAREQGTGQELPLAKQIKILASSAYHSSWRFYTQ